MVGTVDFVPFWTTEFLEQKKGSFKSVSEKENKIWEVSYVYFELGVTKLDERLVVDRVELEDGCGSSMFQFTSFEALLGFTE